MEKRHVILLIKLAVLVVCCILVVRTVTELGPAKVWAQARDAHTGWIIAALAAIAARYLFWLLKWRTMLARNHQVPNTLVWHLIMANGFVNLVTPSAKIAGGFLRAMVLKVRQGWSFPSAYGQVIADQVTHLFGKMLLLGSLLLYAVIVLPDLVPAMIAIPVGLLMLLVTLGWLPIRNFAWNMLGKLDPQSGWRRWLTRISQKVTEDGDDAVEALCKPLLTDGKPIEVWRNDILLSALSFGVLCYSNALVLKSLGASASIATVALVVLLGYLAGTLMGVMGGIGVTELFLMKLYVAVGVPEEAGAVAALLHRGLFYAFMLSLGGISFLIVGRKL